MKNSLKFLLLYLFMVYASILQAQQTDLATYLSSIRHTDALKSRLHVLESQTLSQKNEILSDGFYLNGELGYAKSKIENNNALEYQVGVEKSFLLGSSKAYENTLKFSFDIDKKLQTAKIENIIYQSYINSCFLKEKISILKDEKQRNKKMTALINVGFKGGEFDLSSLYGSQISMENLTLTLLDLDGQYKQSLQRLNIFTLKSLQEPQCSDLPTDIASFEKESFTNSPYFQALDMQVQKQSALKNYRQSSIKQITVGFTYYDEMDLTRSAAYVRIPLTWGAKKTNSIEVAKQQELAAFTQKNYLQKELEIILQAYKRQQHNNAEKLAYINDKLILKAYKTVELMQERFQAGEANYLEYISSQKMLFSYVLQTIQIRKDALSARAKLYIKLGISPLKEQK